MWKSFLTAHSAACNFYLSGFEVGNFIQVFHTHTHTHIHACTLTHTHGHTCISCPPHCFCIVRFRLISDVSALSTLFYIMLHSDSGQGMDPNST